MKSHTKIRILLASVASTIVIISTVYNVTVIFTRNIVHAIVLEEGRQLEIVSSLWHLDDRVQANKASDATAIDTLKESVVTKEFHSANDRKFDKRTVKKNEIQSWNDIEQVLSTTGITKHQHSIETATSQLTNQASKVAKKKAHPKRQSTKLKDMGSKGRIRNREISSDTTVIITANWMPSVPSTNQLDKVINSLTFLHGLPKDAPMIIAVDGAYETGGRYKSERNVDMRQYVKAIKANYKAPHIQIITSSKKIMLVRNIQRALRRVHTKYVLILQHDLPFINAVNYTGLIETMETHSEVRLVRFPTARVLTRNRDGGVCEEEQVDFSTKNTGIKLTKTHVWSDRNHLTQKSYYNEMFQLPGWNGVRTMEDKMQQYGTKNCTYWGSYLYGERGSKPTIFHMDGRRDGQYRTSTKRIYGNLTGLLQQKRS